jgi:ribosome-binding protein aMBF1 (putative translation factor)
VKTLEKFKDELLADPVMRQAYEAMEPEFEIAQAIIRARVARGLTQAQLAERGAPRSPSSPS